MVSQLLIPYTMLYPLHSLDTPVPESSHPFYQSSVLLVLVIVYPFEDTWLWKIKELCRRVSGTVILYFKKFKNESGSCGTGICLYFPTGNLRSYLHFCHTVLVFTPSLSSQIAGDNAFCYRQPFLPGSWPSHLSQVLPILSLPSDDLLFCQHSAEG